MFVLEKRMEFIRCSVTVHSLDDEQPVKGGFLFVPSFARKISQQNKH